MGRADRQPNRRQPNRPVAPPPTPRERGAGGGQSGRCSGPSCDSRILYPKRGRACGARGGGAGWVRAGGRMWWDDGVGEMGVHSNFGASVTLSGQTRRPRASPAGAGAWTEQAGRCGAVFTLYPSGRRYIYILSHDAVVLCGWQRGARGAPALGSRDVTWARPSRRRAGALAERAGGSPPPTRQRPPCRCPHAAGGGWGGALGE